MAESIFHLHKKDLNLPAFESSTSRMSLTKMFLTARYKHYNITLEEYILETPSSKLSHGIV